MGVAERRLQGDNDPRPGGLSIGGTNMNGYLRADQPQPARELSIEPVATPFQLPGGRLTIMHAGEVGTDIAPAVSDDPELAARLADLLHSACSLARALAVAEQAALGVDLDGDGLAARKFFSLSERYARWRDYRVPPQGLGLHGLQLEPGQVIRLTQEEVEAHPAWTGFGDQADQHPPMRGWLAVALCGEDGRAYGLLQLSDKSGGGEFTEEDEERIRELAAFTGAALDALRAARRNPGGR
jgi:GAF domain